MRFIDCKGNGVKLRRRQFLGLASFAAVQTVVLQLARAQDYPTRPVRWLVGFPPGGTTDISARLIGQWLSDRLGQPFIIENRPGAATNLATEEAIRAPADGYTILQVTTSAAINATFYSKLTYNFLKDIAMVAGLINSPLVLEVHPSLPIKSVPEMIAYAKANEGKLSLASFGTGTISQLAGELFKMAAGIDMVHVPYRGSTPMLVDLLGGQVQFAFDNLPASVEHIKSGKLRPLAVTTTKRSSALPDVPTLAEFIPGYEAQAWTAVGAPKNTPIEIINKLNGEINLALADPHIKERLAELGADPFIGSAAYFDQFLVAETEKWAKVIHAANISAD
jgi:tripartite-type tricarboxylate transporter receptor subunit TctC